MTRQQQLVVGAVSALSIFIGVGIALLVTSGGDDNHETIEIGSTTSSFVPPSTLPPITSAPVTTGPTSVTSPPVTQGPITPGTTLIIPPSTTATTKPVTTTTHAPATTTTTQPDRSTDVGITDDEIVLAVIADSPETIQGMVAWQTVVNRHGGLADRKIRLDALETGGSAEGYANAVAAACERDFAIVGSFSRFDTSAEGAGCGAIPDLPVEPVAGDHAAASNTFAAFPRQAGIEAVGPYKWLLGNVSGCCNQFVLVPDGEPERSHTLATIDAATAIGFTTAGTTDISASDDADRYSEILDDLEADGTNFAATGLGRDSAMLLRQAAVGRAPDVQAWYCDASCYDAVFLTDGGDAIDGQYLAIETAPFSDRSEIGALRSYLRTTGRAGEDASYAGLRAFATGMLFEDAAKQVIDDKGENGLTRPRLLASLASIHDFSAGGIVGSTDVATGTPNGCYVLLHVADGRFKRVNPADKAVLDCGSQNLVEL